MVTFEECSMHNAHVLMLNHVSSFLIYHDNDISYHVVPVLSSGVWLFLNQEPEVWSHPGCGCGPEKVEVGGFMVSHFSAACRRFDSVKGAL